MLAVKWEREFKEISANQFTACSKNKIQQTDVYVKNPSNDNDLVSTSANIVSVPQDKGVFTVLCKIHHPSEIIPSDKLVLNIGTSESKTVAENALDSNKLKFIFNLLFNYVFNETMPPTPQI